MRDELLGYYERELVFLRQMGAEYAQRYPKIASRLLLEPDKCEDPHVERIIEAFSFLAGRVHLKIEDEFPEITESFLNVLYPHYLAPIPSMSTVKFAFDYTKGNLMTGYKIERGTTLYSRPIQGTPCRFRTAYGVTLWPIEVISASLESLDPVNTQGRWTEALLKLSLSINGTTLSELRVGEDPQKASPIESLCFFLNGEAQLIYPLYEFIFNNVTRVELRAGEGGRSSRRKRSQASIVLPPSFIRPVGFEENEGLLPYNARSFKGYRLLSEYFAFPEKFLFFELGGLDQAARAGGFGENLEVLIYLRDVAPPRSLVDASTFQLGCTPAVNLFEKIAEPITLTQKKHEYHVIPDVHRQMATEIYSIDSVTSTDPALREPRRYQPFYSFRHAYDREYDRTFWYATRRASQKAEDPGTEMYMSLVDLGFNPNVPAVETLTVHTTCTNRDLPGRLPFGGREGELEAAEGTPLARVLCLTKPTNTLRPPLRRGAHWRLISHLSLNHLSLIGDSSEDVPYAMQEILMLYDFMDSAATRKQITGIERVKSRRVVRQTGSRIGAGLVRGMETTLEFDEEQYVGSGVFIFASVLERFLGLYASLNSFNQLVVKTRQREGELKRWPPRAGDQILL